MTSSDLRWTSSVYGSALTIVKQIWHVIQPNLQCPAVYLCFAVSLNRFQIYFNKSLNPRVICCKVKLFYTLKAFPRKQRQFDGWCDRCRIFPSMKLTFSNRRMSMKTYDTKPNNCLGIAKIFPLYIVVWWGLAGNFERKIIKFPHPQDLEVATQLFLFSTSCLLWLCLQMQTTVAQLKAAI